MIKEEEYLNALEIISKYRKQENIQTENWLEESINESKTLDDVERLEALNDIASDLANQFTYDMSILEGAISDALDEVSIESKEETGYYDVCDVTQDINVTASYEW